MKRLSQVILARWSLIESNNSRFLPRWLRSQHIYILEQNSSHAISNLQYVYSFMVWLKDFHILWVINVLHTTNNKKITDHDTLAKQIMSLLCTAQTVWNKGLKKHWFPIVATYGMCIIGRWTCLWSGTCKIIIIMLYSIIRWQMIDFCRSGNNPRRGQLIDFQWQAMGMPICRKHLFEGETLIWRAPSLISFFSISASR